MGSFKDSKSKQVAYKGHVSIGLIAHKTLNSAKMKTSKKIFSSRVNFY
jgi:hypothetical protein